MEGEISGTTALLCIAAPVVVLILIAVVGELQRKQYAERIKKSDSVRIPSLRGVIDKSSIALLNATFYTSNGSTLECPDPDFANWLIKEIDSNISVFAITEGIVNHRYLCPSCSYELDPNARQPTQMEHQCQYKEFPPFIVQINIPSVVCPFCQKICGIDVDGKTETNLTEALAQAFISQNITIN